MDRFQGQARAANAETPVTDAARFTVTKVDVGSEAVRVGVAAELEMQRDHLLLAAKLVLGRLRGSSIHIGAPYEHALEVAIRQAEVKP